MCCEEQIDEKKRKRNLAERLEEFYGKPIEEIYVENTAEISAGTPVGKEVW